MNSNAVHNILNIAGWVLGGITALLIYSGCTAGLDGRLDCSASTIIPASWLPILSLLTTAMFFLKSVINVGRDGVGGLFKQQPPVASKTTTVVIAQPDSAAPKVDVKTSGAVAKP